MATSVPNQQPPGSSSVSAPQPQPVPPNPDQITWDGDKMFNIYILDYCKKRGYHKTASQLVTEADISPESKPPINAQQGLLFEWWSVFWVLFQAKNSGNGSDDAMLYHKHQSQLKMRATQVPPPGVPQPPGRYPLPNGVAGPVPPLPNAHMNGITPTGPPPSLSAPPYGPANPAAQPNTMPGHPGPPTHPGHPGQPFPGGMAGRPPLGPQQRIPNGGPPYHSPTMAPSPQSQGNPQQPPAGPMGQLGRSPHMSAMNRAAMPPPNGPQPPQGPGHTGSAHPTPTLAYQQLGRPSSSLGTSSQHPMNPHPSPAMGVRVLQTQDRSHMDNAHHSLDAELGSFTSDILGEAKLRANLGGRDAQSLSVEEKKNIIAHAMQLKQNSPQSTGSAGANAQGQMQNRGPMAQPMQQQLSMQPQRVGKRSSTSPGEEHRTLPRNDQSPPDRKRPRKTTPSLGEQQQQQQQQQPQSQPQQPQHQHQQSQSQPPPPQQPQPQPQQQQQQQQQPPMAPIGPIPSGLQSVRGMPMPGGQAPPGGFGAPPMHQMGMAPGPMTMHAISPGMGHGPMSVMNPQQMGPSQLYQQNQFRGPGPGMVNANAHKGGPGDPQAQAHMRAAMANRLPGQIVPPQPGQPPKGMGGPMLPPGQQGMNGPPKPGGKEGEGDHNTPHNQAGSASTPTPLLNTAPPMNPQRPPTATAPLPTPAPQPTTGPMADLSFDMGDMFGNGGGDFDFGPDSLSDMHLWFDPSAVQDGGAN